MVTRRNPRRRTDGRTNWLEWRDDYGQLHNDAGPAVEYYDGETEWWLHGHSCTEQDVAAYKHLDATKKLAVALYLHARKRRDTVNVGAVIAAVGAEQPTLF